MIGSLFFNIISCFFASGRFTNYHRGLIYSVIIIFVFLAIRYDYGNDYIPYFERFYELNRGDFNSINPLLVKGNEIGWVYLNLLFKPFGFFGMQIFLAGFSCFILYRFIKKYVHQKYYWLAIFIYIFQPYHLLVFSSAMRQSVAISLFLFAFDYLIQKKPIHYVLVILFASLFHTTSLILLPLIFLSYVKITPKMGYIFLIFLIPFLLLFYSDLIIQQSTLFTLLYFGDEYSSYLDTDLSSYKLRIGFALNMIIYIMMFYNFRKTRITWQVITFNLIVLSFLIVPLSLSIPLISRINFYFTPFLMIGYSLALSNMKKQNYKLVFIGFIIIFTLYQYFSFFYSDTWSEKFYYYKTIFSLI
jgi:hypothetical protein